jgi:hypothetical protein
MPQAPLSSALVDETLRNLIRQFSQELCFYRELIQNSLDAGSRRIDVNVTWDADRQAAVAQVADSGDGMDRKIIDEQLTRLFSSSKENDFTKIGKFGIGFVSVFAVAPQAVVVDTGRGGESWRVLFKPTGEFERLRLDDVVEGTTVRVYVSMGHDKYDDFVARSYDTVRYWCRHAAADVFFNHEKVNEGFDLDALIKVHADEGGTEIVAALSAEAEPFFGFYNGGITLLEGHKTLVPGVAFKLKSRYLEHTLTRDNVKQEVNYHRAMHQLGHVVETQLVPRMLELLQGAGPVGSLDELLRVCRGRLSACWRTEAAKVPFVPLVRGSGESRLASPQDIVQVAARTAALLERLGAHCGGRTLLVGSLERISPAPYPPPTDKADDLSVAVRALEVVNAGPTLLEVLREQGYNVLAVDETLVALRPAAGFEDLAAATLRLLRASGVHCKDVVAAEMGDDEYTHLAFHHQEAVAVRQAPVGLGSGQWREWWDPPRVALNASHPLVARLREHGRLGPYLLARLLCGEHTAEPGLGARLLEHAL